MFVIQLIVDVWIHIVDSVYCIYIVYRVIHVHNVFFVAVNFEIYILTIKNILEKMWFIFYYKLLLNLIYSN